MTTLQMRNENRLEKKIERISIVFIKKQYTFVKQRTFQMITYFSLYNNETKITKYS